MEEDKDPIPLPKLFFSPRTNSMSCLLCFSPDLHCRHPAVLSGAEVKHVLSLPLSPCITMCVFQCVSQAVSSSPNFSLSFHLRERHSVFTSSFTLSFPQAWTRLTARSDSSTSLCRYHRQFLYFEWRSSWAGPSPSCKPSHSFVHREQQEALTQTYPPEGDHQNTKVLVINWNTVVGCTEKHCLRFTATTNTLTKQALKLNLGCCRLNSSYSYFFVNYSV